jgi:phosphatidylglycerophosphatase C
LQLAIFDLDGTVTRRDTFLPFLLGWLTRRPWRLVKLLGFVGPVCAFALHRDRGRLKSTLLRVAMAGQTRAQLASWVEEFVQTTLAQRTLPAALATIEQHRLAGDRLVLMSASVDVYVPALGARLGFAEVICTEVRWDGEVLHGALTSENRRGEEKARCFRALAARHQPSASYAYGNSSTDLPHLLLATHGVLVNANAATRRAAAAVGLETRSWH